MRKDYAVDKDIKPKDDVWQFVDDGWKGSGNILPKETTYV